MRHQGPYPRIWKIPELLLEPRGGSENLFWVTQLLGGPYRIDSTLENERFLFLSNVALVTCSPAAFS